MKIVCGVCGAAIILLLAAIVGVGAEQDGKAEQATPDNASKVANERIAAPEGALTLEQILSRMPKDGLWSEFDHSPDAVGALQAALANPQLAAAALAALEAEEEMSPRTVRLLWLVPRLPGGDEVLTKKLKSKDPIMQGGAITMIFYLRLAPRPKQDEFVAALRSKDIHISSATMALANLELSDDIAFYKEAFAVPELTAYAIGGCDPKVQEALLPMVLKRLGELRTDDDVFDQFYLLDFVVRYDRIKTDEYTIEGRDRMLKCHKELEEIRDKYSDEEE